MGPKSSGANSSCRSGYVRLVSCAVGVLSLASSLSSGFFSCRPDGLVCSASQSLGVGALRGRVMLTVLFCELLVGALFPHGLSYGVPGLSG